jgi:hypothetical protein
MIEKYKYALFNHQPPNSPLNGSIKNIGNAPQKESRQATQL